MKAIADEAHMLHLRVAAHAHGDEGIHDAILRRDRHDRAWQPGSRRKLRLALARKQPVWFSMDINNDDYTVATAARTATEQENLDKEKAIALKQRADFPARRPARRADGVRIGCRRVSARRWSGKQFAKMVEYGMTPLQAIQAATRNASQALGTTGDVGAIEVGRYGDLVAVTGDPTRDVRRAGGSGRGDQGRKTGPKAN